MKIAMFSDVFLPKIDGVGIAILNTAKNLADNEHEVIIVAPRYPGFKKEISYPGIKIYRIDSIPSGIYAGINFSNIISGNLLKFLVKEKINVIHFHTTFALGFAAIFIARILKVPLIGSFHINISHDKCLEHSPIKTKATKKISLNIIKLFYNRCDLVVCPSDNIRKDFLSKILKSPLRTIPNGVVDPNKKAPKYNLFNFEKNLKYLLFVGRISNEKNLFYLLDCFNKLVKQQEDFRLILVGDGPQMKELKSYSKFLGLQNKVFFTGNIPHFKLINSNIYEGCGLYVTPSLTEVQSISTLEAQVRGLVSLGLDIPGNKEIIINGHSGILIKEGDSQDFVKQVIRFFDDKEYAKKLKLNNLKRASQHLIENTTKQLEKTYAELATKCRIKNI